MSSHFVTLPNGVHTNYESFYGGPRPSTRPSSSARPHSPVRPTLDRLHTLSGRPYSQKQEEKEDRPPSPIRHLTLAEPIDTPSQKE